MTPLLDVGNADTALSSLFRVAPKPVQTPIEMKERSLCRNNQLRNPEEEPCI